MADENRLRDDPLWYKDTIIYEVRVGSFYDSNADGMGDFKGLTEKLDYLHENPVRAGTVYEAQEYIYSSAIDYRTTKKCKINIEHLEF